MRKPCCWARPFPLTAPVGSVWACKRGHRWIWSSEVVEVPNGGWTHKRFDLRFFWTGDNA